MFWRIKSATRAVEQASRDLEEKAKEMTAQHNKLDAAIDDLLKATLEEKSQK